MEKAQQLSMLETSLKTVVTPFNNDGRCIAMNILNRSYGTEDLGSQACLFRLQCLSAFNKYCRI